MFFRDENEKIMFLSRQNDDKLVDAYPKEILNGPNQIYKYCFKCNIVRPERAHHCGVCNVCTLLYDHHCPWVGNCVAYNSHKFFVLFCLYVTIGTFFIAIRLFPCLIDLYEESGSMVRGGFLYALLGILMGLMLSGTNGFLFFYHCFLILNNQTTVERHMMKFNNKFKFDSILKNWEVIFGKNKWTWFLPLIPYRPNIDPYSFENKGEIAGTFSVSIDPK